MFHQVASPTSLSISPNYSIIYNVLRVPYLNRFFYCVTKEIFEELTSYNATLKDGFVCFRNDTMFWFLQRSFI
jgi:hypothetical protein